MYLSLEKRPRAIVDARAFAIGLAFILAVGALVSFFCAVAGAGESTLTERIVAVVPSLASKKEESVDPQALAEAIASVPKVNGQWAALILTIAAHESALSQRIADGDCRPKECDHGNAAGLYQGHKNQFNADVWGSPDIKIQTLEAARALRSAFYQCGALKHPDWALRTMRAYGTGRGCNAKMRGEEQRVATFNRLKARL